MNRYLCPECNRTNVALDKRANAFLCLSSVDGKGCSFYLDVPKAQVELFDGETNGIPIQQWISLRGRGGISFKRLIAGMVVEALTEECPTLDNKSSIHDAKLIVTRVLSTYSLE